MKIKLTKSNVDKLLKEKNAGYYSDTDLPRFFLRIQQDKRTGNISSAYFIKYRDENGIQHTPKVCGTDGTLTPDEARTKAKKMLNDVDNGIDPLKIKKEKMQELTVEELSSLYMQEGILHKKESTINTDNGRLKRHIIPLIGNIHIKSLSRSHIEKMVLDITNGKKIYKNEKSEKARGRTVVTGGKATAIRTLQLLSAILNFAVNRNIIDKNPASGIKKPRSNKKEVFLTLQEIKQFATILNNDENPFHYMAINALKLLFLTGCRKTEILSLKWKEIDFEYQCFRFADTKTGAQTRPFGNIVASLLKSMQEYRSSSPYVFPATRGNGYYKGLPKIFNQLKHSKDKNNALILEKEITLHTLRHTFVSIAADMGYTEFTIAGIVGHKLDSVTNRYSHAVDSSLIAAANNISQTIYEALKEQ